MPRLIHHATVFVACLLLAACNPQASATTNVTIAPPTEAPTAEPTAAPTVAPTPLPTPTAVPTIAANVEVAGVAVGGMTAEAARTTLAANLNTAPKPLFLAAGTLTTTLEPNAIGLLPNYDSLVATAQGAAAGAEIPLALTYDEAKLRSALEALATNVAGPGSGVAVVRDTEAMSASFTLQAPTTLNVDQALTAVATYYANPTATAALTLSLALGQPVDSRPTIEQLQAEINALAKDFKGVIGVYVHDIKSDSEIASLNKGTAFSTASTIKVAIMLNAYLHVKSFDTRTQNALQKMIIDSDNLRANDVLAASVGGRYTEDAFAGAALMSKTLADLGLPTTYQYTPFEATDFIKQNKTKYQTGPKQAGEAPFTNSSRVQRTTPYEMAQIYRLIEQCTRGEGKLIEQFGDTISADRCQEMFSLLTKNADGKRMRSGLPADIVVAHKSGWAQPEVQGDAGIVRTPGGDFIISVYVYQPGEKYSDRFVQRLLGNLTRLVYTYYNPVVVSGT